MKIETSPMKSFRISAAPIIFFLLLFHADAYATQSKEIVNINPSIAGSDLSYLIRLYGEDVSTCSESTGAIAQSLCMQKTLEVKEAEMNNLLGKVIEGYDSSLAGSIAASQENIKRIQDSQKAWLTYRDGLCNFGYASSTGMHSGSMAVSVYTCELLKTAARVEEIKNIYFAHRE